MKAKTQEHIQVTIERRSARFAKGDVLALKYAQGLYGVDDEIVSVLQTHDIHIEGYLPGPSSYFLVETNGFLPTKSVLFIGVKPLHHFGYQQVREFGRRVLSTLAEVASNTKNVLVTIHGANYGLDEKEVFESQIAGFMDAVNKGDYPKKLEHIIVIEIDPRRSEVLGGMRERLLPEPGIPIPGAFGRETLNKESADRLRTVGYNSANKPHVFVAMPFSEEMDDIYHYGIQGAVNAAGFLCERADLSSFTGDVMSWVKRRIGSANLVIADMSFGNPNVYLEVGYAWGCNRPTVLLVNDPNSLKFDVRGQRCLVYKKIRDLEEKLHIELESLKDVLGLVWPSKL